MKSNCRPCAAAILAASLMAILGSGCADKDTADGRLQGGATPENASTGASHLSATTTSTIPRLYDGFEGNAVSDFWLPGNYGSGLYVPGAIRLSTNYSRSGARSAQITVRQGDVDAAGDAGTRVERSELDSGHFRLLGQEAWYGFSVLIPPDFPIVDNRLVISSCKQSDVSRPLTAQRFRNGKHTLTVESQGRKEQFRLPALPLGKWVDFVCYARYSPEKNGAFQLWMNGWQVVSYSGPLADPASKNAFYHKIGLYRDRWKQPMTIYFDNYSMGNSYEFVDPARFESNAGTVR